jgi:hypothetical protein
MSRLCSGGSGFSVGLPRRYHVDRLMPRCSQGRSFCLMIRLWRFVETSSSPMTRPLRLLPTNGRRFCPSAGRPDTGSCPSRPPAVPPAGCAQGSRLCRTPPAATRRPRAKSSTTSSLPYSRTPSITQIFIAGLSACRLRRHLPASLSPSAFTASCTDLSRTKVASVEAWSRRAFVWSGSRKVAARGAIWVIRARRCRRQSSEIPS